MSNEASLSLDSINNQLAEMKALFEATQKDMRALQQKYNELMHQHMQDQEKIAWMQKKLYARQTERARQLECFKNQPTLWEEEPVSSVSDQPASKQESVKVQGHERAKKKTYEENFKDAVHVEVLLEPAAEDLICPECGTEMVPCGKKFLGYKVKVEPARFIVQDIYSQTYNCPACKKEGRKDSFASGKSEYPVIPHSYATPEAVTHTLVERFEKAVPFNRQLREWKRNHITMSRTTLSNWSMSVSELWLEPLVKRMKVYLLQEGYIHADETRMIVLNEEDKENTALSYMWVYSSIKESQYPIRLFNYCPGRGGCYAEEFLAGFSGVLITDAYAGYNKVKGVKRAACWAHARRKYVEALDGKSKTIGNLPEIALNKIGELFAIEQEIAALTPEVRKTIRQTKSKPIADEFFAWARETRLAKNYSSDKMNEALRYSVNHEKELRSYLEDGNIPMTNNLDERTVRMFVNGRKNWMFSGSPRGAKSNGVCYSIVETAKANGLDVYKYLTYVLTCLPRDACDLTDQVLDSFLPWNPEIQKICAITVNPKK